MTQLLTPAQFRSIVQAGVLAPSADNHLPFLFDHADTAILLYGNADFQQAGFHRRILMCISAGAVVQNMTIAASLYGRSLNAQWFPDPESPALIARVEVGPTAEPDFELARAISQRHTNRRLRFRGPRLPVAQHHRLSSEVNAASGVSIEWLDAPETRRSALRLIRWAESERFRCEPMHKELFGSVRFDVGWNQGVDQGLAPGTLGVERLLRGPFTALRHWSVMRALSTVGGHRVLGFRAGDLPCRLSPHLAVIATSLPGELGALAVGGAFERLWLRASTFGLALQPLVASALFALEGYQDVREVVRERLRRGWADILGQTLQPLVVFRLGLASAPAITNGRLEVESYMRQAQKENSP